MRINKINMTMVMGETFTTDMIATPDWMIYQDQSSLLDIERQSYMAFAMEQKFNNAIANNDVTKLYEIVFHFLNINALQTDRKLYDANFREIRDNQYLAQFVDNLVTERDGDAAQIISQINDVYTRIISKYMKFAIETLNGVNVTYFDSQNIHYSNLETYLLFNIKPHEFYELWKVSYKTETTLGSEIEHLENFEMKAGQITHFKDFIRTYNRKMPVSRIRSGNFAAITCDTAKNSKSIVSLVKDTILLNKIFYDKNQFNPKVLPHIYQIVIDKNTFPFKLLMQ